MSAPPASRRAIGPAPGADGVHVERGEPDGIARDGAAGRGQGDAAADEADVGARAAHVERHRVGETTRRGDGRRGADATSRAGEQQRGGEAGGVGGRDEAPGRREDEHLVGNGGELLEVDATDRAEQRVRDRGDRALVLAELRGHLVRAGDVDAPGAQRGADGALVAGVEVGVQEAHRDRAHAGGQLGDRRGVERLELPARAVEAPADLETVAAVDERRRPVDVQVVERRAGLARDLEHVREADGGEEGHGRAAALEERVRGDGRAVGEHRRGAGREAERLADRAGGRAWRRRDLDDAAVLGDEVGERASGVNADPHRVSVARRTRARSGAQLAAGPAWSR